MNCEENLRTTPSKGGAKKGTKNAKITNFFTKVNSPLTDDTSSSSMKAPLSSGLDDTIKRTVDVSNKDYVFIVPSSDDDTNASTTKRKRPPSVHSNNSKSSDGFVLTNANNELGIARKKRVLDLMGSDSNSNNGASPSSTLTPTRSSSRDSTPTNQSGPKINRIQPTLIGCRTKMIDFQSVPSDLNLPRDQAQRLIEKLFILKMPEDFFQFWEFAKTINHRKPCAAFSQAYLEWTLVGPYDVLSGLITDFHGFSRDDLLRHCRFYYDIPEFQTVILKKDEQITHFGYYRDEPNQEKPIVVMNRAAINGQFYEAGDNLFTLLRSELESSIATLSKSSQEVPTFSSSSSRTPRSAKVQSEKQSQLEKAKAKQELTIIRDKLLDFCSNHENLSSESWSRTNMRRAKRVTKTMNTLGVMIPRNADVSDREISITDAKLKGMMARISECQEDKSQCVAYKELHQIIDRTLSAKEQSCFCLQLGLDLFFHGDSFFNKDIECLLKNAYTHLNRTEFFDILKSHLGDRKSGDKNSLLD